MQKCYNCGKEVDDNVLICPECGALVKRYGKPEAQQAEPFLWLSFSLQRAILTEYNFCVKTQSKEFLL